MVGVDGSSPFAPTKFGREDKHLAETLGAFFLAVREKYKKAGVAAPPGAAPAARRTGASVRSIVKPPFHVIKNLFGDCKVSCCCGANNEARAKAQVSPAHLSIARRRWMDQRVNASAGIELLGAQQPGDCEVRISANVTVDFGNVTDLGLGAALRDGDCRNVGELAG